MSTEAEMHKKKLIPMWIKVFGCLFIIMGVAVSLLPISIWMWCPICSGHSEPITAIEAVLPNSKGSFVATVEGVDNGLGFGLGMLYGEVHLTKQDEPIGSHGDKDDTAIFYVQEISEGSYVKANWENDTTLVVHFRSEAKPGKKIASLHGITIKYIDDATEK